MAINKVKKNIIHLSIHNQYKSYIFFIRFSYFDRLTHYIDIFGGMLPSGGSPCGGKPLDAGIIPSDGDNEGKEQAKTTTTYKV